MSSTMLRPTANRGYAAWIAAACSLVTMSVKNPRSIPMPARTSMASGPRRSGMPSEVCKAIASQTLSTSLAPSPCAVRNSAARSAPSISKRTGLRVSRRRPMSCRTVPAKSSDSSTSPTRSRWSRSRRAKAQLRTLWFATDRFSSPKTKSNAAAAHGTAGAALSESLIAGKLFVVIGTIVAALTWGAPLSIGHCSIHSRQTFASQF